MLASTTMIWIVIRLVLTHTTSRNGLVATPWHLRRPARALLADPVT